MEAMGQLNASGALHAADNTITHWRAGWVGPSQSGQMWSRKNLSLIL